MIKLYNFLRNIKFLLTHDIRDEFQNQRYQTLLDVEDYCNFELKENHICDDDRIKIYSYDETIATLLREPKSFCRFGDGEIDIINGKSIPFQKYDEKLAKIMFEILEDETTDLYVGINYNYFHSTKMLNEYNRKFYMMDARKYRDFLLKHCSKNRKYIAAGFNQLYIISDMYNYEEYYKKLKSLFANKDIVLFVGQGILQCLEFDIFDESNSKIIIEGPSRNAFAEYDNILDKARHFDKNKVLCFILGPTSKALVYQLAKEGYLAWDIGHMAKDYDMYMKKGQKNASTIADFFSPD